MKHLTPTEEMGILSPDFTSVLTRNHQDVLRAFRRRVFNMPAHNRDVHVKAARSIAVTAARRGRTRRSILGDIACFPCGTVSLAYNFLRSWRRFQNSSCGMPWPRSIWRLDRSSSF
jgi:hypothetical protein